LSPNLGNRGSKQNERIKMSMKEKEHNENVKEWQKYNDEKQESLIWKKTG
jgi:hypothetical protein